MFYAPDDIDDETLAEAETEAFTRPSDASFWDERMYTTHAPVMSWADRGDDILEASNFHAALAELQAADDTGETVFDCSVSHWLVGSLQQIWVRARDESGAFTPAWRTAVSIALSLKESPMLDESDFSERETEAFDTAFDDALWQARNAFDSARWNASEAIDVEDMPDDITDEQHETVCDTLREDTGNFYGESPADVDYTEVIAEYARVATELLARVPVSLIRAELRGQARLI